MFRTLVCVACICAASAALAQDYTPAPVDLTASPGLSDVTNGLQVYVAEDGEVFMWNAGSRLAPIDGFTMECSADCLIPGGVVEIVSQAVEHIDQYRDVYGAGVFSFGGFTPRPDAITGFSLNSINFPTGPEFAISLGKILEPNLEQIRLWAANGTLKFHYSGAGFVTTTPAVGFQVVPEPAALASMATLLAFAGLLRHSQRRKARA